MNPQSIGVRVFALLVLAFLLGCSAAWGQNAGAMQGQITDPTRAATAQAKVEITDTASGVTRTTTTDASGTYSFTQLRPGVYRVRVSRQGFKTFVREPVEVLVSTPTTLDIRLELGSLSETVTVEAEAVPMLNTSDATVGNPFSEKEVKALPFLARNVVNLLTLQPGVVFTGLSDTDELAMGSVQDLDTREGAVDGIRGNQTNVTLDGVDANDWQNQAAFTSALPVTLDSVQEFRVTTTNANATDGLVGGSQVALVIKSGAKDFHGNVRWYYRTAGPTANSFFNDLNGIGRPQLVRNIPGGSLGGPIKKDRFFFFVDYEGRQDTVGKTVVAPRIVPTDALRDGVLIYKCRTASQCPGGTSVMGITGPHPVAAGTFGLTPANIVTIDPAGRGVNPAMVPYMNLFPHGNSPSAGRDNGLAFTGFVFNAPTSTSNNIYTMRLDYKITSDGRHTIFGRGILAGIKTDLREAQFPGQAPASTLLNNSRGTVVQYQGQFSSNLINTFRWGFTRLGVSQSGIAGPRFAVRSFSDTLNFTARAAARRVPVHELNDDITWVRGKHTLQFGGVVRFIRNNRFDDTLSFPRFFANNGFCTNLCGDAAGALRANRLPRASSTTTFTRAFMMLTGSITQVNGTFFADPKSGAILPSGSRQPRKFAENNVETYVQDSWRVRPNLTLTAGLRYGYTTPPWEVNGLQARTTTDIQEWFFQRIQNMNAGIPSSASPLLAWELAGKVNGKPSWYNPNHKDFGPRLALAYTPGFSNSVLKALLGSGGKSTIRLGVGIFFDRMGQALAVDSDQNGSPGIATALIDGSQQFSLATAPRFSGSCNSSGCKGFPSFAPFFPVPGSVTFPFTPTADTSNLGFAVDPHLRTPYSIHLTASFQRELPKRVVLDVTYVGTLGRRLLGKIDYAQYLNIRDPKSHVDLWSAFQKIAAIADFRADPNNPGPTIDPADLTALATIQSIPFFDNMLPNMPAFADAFFPGSGYANLTPTQAFYAFSVNNAGQSWSCALYPLDTVSIPASSSFGLPSPWNKTVDPKGAGLVLFQPQFSALPGWTNWANSNYHSLQVSVRKNLGVATFGLNYVFSRSIDNDSAAENADIIPGTNGTLTGLIQNPFDLRAGRGLSDFQIKHNFSGLFLVDLPFGRGKKFGSSANRAVDALIGGWEVTGLARWHSGFPESIGNGFNFPTNFFLTTPGTLIAPVQSGVTRKGLGGLPNLFADSAAALNNVAFTLPGLSGSRNALIGPAYAGFDTGIHKTFRMPWGEHQRLQFRAAAFNVFNSVNFNDAGGSLTLDPTSPSTFGKFSNTAGVGGRGGAREMEFAIRYEF